MPETQIGKGRTHNAEGAREAILNAAEKVFSEHGFDGARIDEIATEAGYNKGLIFRYFGDKLRLYLEVIRRVDAGTRGIQARAISALMQADSLNDPQRIAALVKTFIGEVFDYHLQNPRVTRILQWEMAESWRNYRQIAPQIDDADFEKMKLLLAQFQKTGLLRSTFDPLAQIITAIFQPVLFLGLLPFYPIFSPAEDLQATREFVMEFVAGGLLVGPKDTGSKVATK